MAIYCYTVNIDIIIWCGVAYTWAPAEFFVEGGGASLKRGAERPHLIKKISVREKRPPHREK